MKFFAAVCTVLLTSACALPAEKYQPIPIDVVAAQQEAARQKSEWQLALQKYNMIKSSDLDGMDKCRMSFDISWDLSKRGNYEARYSLYTSLEQGWIIFENFKVTNRDLDILYLHGLGIPGAPRNALSHAIQRLPDLVTIRTATNNPAYRQCMLDRPSQECADILVRAGVIPSFDEWAKSFDQRLSKTVVGCLEFARRAGG